MLRCVSRNPKHETFGLIGVVIKYLNIAELQSGSETGRIEGGLRLHSRP